MSDIFCTEKYITYIYIYMTMSTWNSPILSLTVTLILCIALVALCPLEPEVRELPGGSLPPRRPIRGHLHGPSEYI